MAGRAKVLPALLAAALCAVLLRSLAVPAGAGDAFVPSPQLRSTANQWAVQERAAAALPAAAVVAAPGLAEAATEQELNVSASSSRSSSCSSSWLPLLGCSPSASSEAPGKARRVLRAAGGVPSNADPARFFVSP
eukprot:CAMPEP_0204583414 /NCGR_PEP_ID=MMETSP0661-20131031/45762_1 /ASSEMBLY_ACC=CAM_ASM_000606 /TAXON_ID=109239 /ORGANISM="Alexandrium margalefi, Strain AMGDE01CS-322" /LENGTH=134 /DNA_ID=CAMNT_0051592765 /DNA_START=83 /DNA_END=485 /DNA_ORIENTATION=+